MIIQEAPVEHSRSPRSVKSTDQQNTGVFMDANPVFHFLNARRANYAEKSVVIPEIMKVDDVLKTLFSGLNSFPTFTHNS